MNKIINTTCGLIRRLGIFLLVTLFSFIVTITLIGWSVTNLFRDPNTYLDLIQQTQLAERGRGLLADVMVSYALSSDLPNATYLGDFSEQTWESVAQILLPVDWLEVNLVEIAHSALDWLSNSKYQVPQFTIDLSPIIQILRSPQGALAILPLLQEIPICTPDVKEIEIIGGTQVSCLPDTKDITPIGQAIARSISNSIMSEVSFITLQQAAIVTPQIIQVMDKIREGVHILDLFLVVGFRLALLILCFYALLHSASTKALIAALPVPLLVAGSISLALVGIFQIFLSLGLELSMTAFLPGLKPDVQALLVDVVRITSQGLNKRWFYGSLILLSVGLVLYLIRISIGLARARREIKSKALPKARPRIRKQYR